MAGSSVSLDSTVNIYNFATCPIEYLVDENEGMSIPALFKTPLFWIAIILMVCSGASELSMAQWLLHMLKQRLA